MRRLPAQKAARKEKTDEHGLPDRIYRGRIIELLRGRDWPALEIDGLGEGVKEGFSSEDRAWLVGLLQRLERDGLVKRGKGLVRLA